MSIDAENRTESKIEENIKKKEDDEKNYLLVSYNTIQNKVTKKNYEKHTLGNDYVIYDGYKYELINIDIPAHYKKKLSNKLSSCLLGSKKKSKKGGSEENMNYKIQCAFYKFWVNILAGYTDYFLKSKYFYETTKNKNCGDNMRYKSQSGNFSDINFLKELFNVDEFVQKTSREN